MLRPGSMQLTQHQYAATQDYLRPPAPSSKHNCQRQALLRRALIALNSPSSTFNSTHNMTPIIRRYHLFDNQELPDGDDVEVPQHRNHPNVMVTEQLVTRLKFYLFIIIVLPCPFLL